MFGGGGVGPPMGGGGAPGSAQAGLPFGGIPHELQAGVDLLLEEEPERGQPTSSSPSCRRSTSRRS